MVVVVIVIASEFVEVWQVDIAKVIAIVIVIYFAELVVKVDIASRFVDVDAVAGLPPALASSKLLQRIQRLADKCVLLTMSTHSRHPALVAAHLALPKARATIAIRSQRHSQKTNTLEPKWLWGKSTKWFPTASVLVRSALVVVFFLFYKRSHAQHTMVD